MATNLTHPHPSSAQQAPSNLVNHPPVNYKGYPELAAFFSRFTRYLHLRRFSAVAVRLLLYRQHELIELERKLEALEHANAHDSDPDKRLFSGDFTRLKAQVHGAGRHDTQKAVYETLKSEMKEYEEALIRFDRLAQKGYDPKEVCFVQRFIGGNIALTGRDTTVWGFPHDPEKHAPDLIQVMDRDAPSTMGSIFRDRFLLWIPNLPGWLQILLTGSRRQPDSYGHHSFSNRRLEVAFLSIGNVVVSLLMYVAMTSMYLTSRSASSVIVVIAIAITSSICGILFKNQRFINTLGTVCAVLVTLLLNDGSQQPRPTQTQPALATSKICKAI